MVGDKIKQRWRVTFSLSPEQSRAFSELARQARTSPSMLGQLAIIHVLRDFETATPLIPHVHDDPDGPRLVRVTVNVTYEEYAGVMALALRAKSSTSALGQLAIGRLLTRYRGAAPLIRPASSLPEGEPRLYGGSAPSPPRN